MVGWVARHAYSLPGNGCGIWNGGAGQDGGDAQAFQGVAQHGIDFLAFRQLPRLHALEVFVGVSQDLPSGIQSHRGLNLLPGFGCGFAGRGHACSQGAVWGGSWADAAGFGFRYCRNSPKQVAVGVGEVARVAAEERFVAEVVVGAEGGVSEHGVAEAVYAEFFRHVFGRYLVELGFGHFFAAD